MNYDDVGVNFCQFTGFVGKYVKVGETKHGTPTVKFIIKVGTGAAGFTQRCIVYGTLAIHLSQTLEEGDLVMITGSKRMINVMNKRGYKDYADFVAGKHCYVLETRAAREERMSK